MNRIRIGIILAAIALDAAAQVDSHRSNLPAGEGITLGPWVQYLTPDSAAVMWETAEACPSVVALGRGEAAKRRIEDAAPKTQHRLVLEGLDSHAVYQYSIVARRAGAELPSEDYVFDTTFNYTVPPVPEGCGNAAAAGAAGEILAATGITKGYALVYGLTDGALACELARQSELVVTGFDTDAARVNAIRARLTSAGAYGARITVRSVASLDALPVTGDFANLIVSERALEESALPGSPEEMRRVTRPGGGAICVPMSAKGGERLASIPGLRAAYEGDQVIFRRAPLPEAGTWTHQYGDPANTSNSGDTLGGAAGTGDLDVQWLGRPGADFGIDRNPRMPAPIAVNGRLFHQGLNRMIAVDAYNGAVLWLLEIPYLRRVNIPRDASNWCADADSVYTAIKDRLWRVDAQTGAVVQAYALPPGDAGKAYEWSYAAEFGGLLYGSTAPAGSSYTDFWGKSAWYDQTAGPGTHKVCSETLFAFDKPDGGIVWSYRNGAILNTTIAIAEDSVHFVESRHPSLRNLGNGRVDSEELWADQYLVALDAKTGAVKYEQPIDTMDGIVVFFLVAANGVISINASQNGRYYLYAYDAANGQPLWQADHPWPDGDHGGHMQHQAVANNVVYVEPRGYDLRTGAIVTENMGKREGCATVAATKHALIYRGQARRVAMWDIENEKVSAWMNLRPSCWLSVIPSAGMVLAPEGGGGCSCGNWVETSLVFTPAKQ